MCTIGWICNRGTGCVAIATHANPSYKLASISRYDGIVRTAGWAGSARAAGRRPAGAPKTACRIREAGAAGPPPTGAFSTLLRQSGLRASTAGVLATKSERKMLASTCLYSLYAWFLFSGHSVVDLLKHWLQEATSMFYMRSKGDIQVDMFKVLGERQVSFVTNFFITIFLVSYNNNTT